MVCPVCKIEAASERPVIKRKRVFSRVKNEYVTKKVKKPISEIWKGEIMGQIIERKKQNMTVVIPEIEDSDEEDFDLDGDNMVQELDNMQYEDDDVTSDEGEGEPMET